MSNYIEVLEDDNNPYGHVLYEYTFADTEQGHDCMQWCTWAMEQEDPFLLDPWMEATAKELGVDCITGVRWNEENNRLQFQAIVWA